MPALAPCSSPCAVPILLSDPAPWASALPHCGELQSSGWGAGDSTYTSKPFTGKPWEQWDSPPAPANPSWGSREASPPHQWQWDGSPCPSGLNSPIAPPNPCRTLSVVSLLLS